MTISPLCAGLMTPYHGRFTFMKQRIRALPCLWSPDHLHGHRAL